MNLLISSAGRRAELTLAAKSAIQSLGGGDVIAVDMSPLSSAGHLADIFELVPGCLSEAFIPALLDICERNSVSALFPTIDTELAAYASNREQFESIGTEVIVSGPETVAISADKQTSSQWLDQSGFPVPQQFDPSAPSAFDEPRFFKPRAGSSSIGAVPVNTRSEYEHAASLHDGVLEELVVGDEYTVDVWVDQAGSCRCAVPRRRIAVRAGEIAKGITVSKPVIEDLARRVAEALPEARGPLTIQIMDGKSGPKVIEINPRLGGGFPLSRHAGARYLEATLLEVTGRPVPEELFQWRPGVVMLRYDAAVFVDGADVGL